MPLAAQAGEPYTPKQSDRPEAIADCDGETAHAFSLAGGFNGPLNYGDAPPGAAIITAAQPLVQGTDYRFFMYADLDEASVVIAGLFTR